MTTRAILLSTLLLAVLGRSRPAFAEDSYNAPLVGLTVPFGAASGWGTGDTIVSGGGVFVGGRWLRLRAGALGEIRYWRGSPEGAAVDGGMFLSWDFGSVWVDPALSLAGVVRVEPTTFRWVSSTSRWAYVPSLVVGGRAGGIELALAGSPEFGLSPIPGASSLGIDLELRISVEFFELCALFAQNRASHAPLPP